MPAYRAKSEADVVEYCKKRGLLLLAQSADARRKTWYLQFEDYRGEEEGGEHWFSLFKAVAAADCGADCLDEDAVDSVDAQLEVSKPLLDELNRRINLDDSNIRRVSMAPIHRAFVYIDVSDFSIYPSVHQALIINSVTLRALPFAKLFKAEAQLCIGDGYIYVFQRVVSAVRFAADLAHRLQDALADDDLPVEFHFRASIHYGPVYRFYDYGREEWNYVGNGINGGNRVLTAIGKALDDVVYVSDAIERQLRKAHADELLKCLDNKGRHADKHGKLWRIYQLSHDRAVVERQERFKSRNKVRVSRKLPS